MAEDGVMFEGSSSSSREQMAEDGVMFEGSSSESSDVPCGCQWERESAGSSMDIATFEADADVANRIESAGSFATFEADADVANRIAGVNPVPDSTSSLVTAFRAGVFMVEFLQQTFGAEKLRESLLNHANLFSSHCSGIGSPEQACDILQAALTATLGWPKRWQSVSACEINKACCAILEQKLPSDCCINRNIFDAFPGWDSSLGPSPTVLERWTALCSAWRPDIKLPCAAHGGLCKQRRSNLNVTGSPCQPWSKAGRKQKTSDVRFNVTLAYLCWIWCTKPVVALHENVLGFHKNIIPELIGSLYKVIDLHIQPSDAGFVFVGRPRHFAIIVRKDVEITRNMLTVLQEASKYIKEKVGFPRVSACMVATAEECLLCENKARLKRGLGPLTVASSDWSYLLTTKQVGYLRDYHKLWEEQNAKKGAVSNFPPDLLMNLSQDPNVRPAMFQHLPTMRASGGILWSPSMKRWLLDRECALAMGWPVLQATASAAGVPMDSFDYKTSQLGNSMHVFAAMLALAVALGCTRMQVEHRPA
ncbi:unnamed protein product [Symbiodinium natans]|uniref:Uncharacterized protein n=1 Tax=Symbiodinium natans TaxID=878477 RepID=A0A812NAK1_9DINO|nr:unnamed protein product [Symbiodinium natans]